MGTGRAICRVTMLGTEEESRVERIGLGKESVG